MGKVNKIKVKFGPEIFNRVYTRWATENQLMLTDWRGNNRIMQYNDLGHRRKAKFNEFVFANGFEVLRENKKWYLGVLNENDPNITFFLLQNQ